VTCTNCVVVFECDAWRQRALTSGAELGCSRSHIRRAGRSWNKVNNYFIPSLIFTPFVLEESEEKDAPSS
jgi:hypothetical protein